MTYLEAARNLARAGAEAGVPIALVHPEQAVDRAIFGNALAREIQVAGYPAGVELPWVVEELYLYSLGELAERQAGYRYDVRTVEAAADWDTNQHVIADWAANPIIIGADGAIRYARHGRRNWTYALIAPDLPGFFNLLAAWLRYFVVERGGNLFNDSFEIDDPTRNTVRDMIRTATGLDDPHAALALLVGK
ncbi:hypothetical protein QLH51_08410 [Sphingomonas sp. 2R-10]|uniref:hypothetical protein n=1 Tax=Sphingomonas sp. 2R-10 TaxID=3045148 RepID=UPI0024BBA4A4|nr:hypothetical protein [Sphingomonas sp. 2R-10]MDJ0276815.1 hypothetical protein [Sphingomonas sp. 2R-10]